MAKVDTKTVKNPPELQKEVDKQMDKYEEKVDGNEFDSLIKQIEIEFQLAWLNQQTKIQVHLERLRLYNNQMRDKKAVGDPLMFTVHQTILASLYDDRLGVEFIGWEEGDMDQASNLSAMAEFDYIKMKKDELDYFWDWDTGFYGRGLVELSEFDRAKNMMCPLPSIIDPATFLRDPKGVSINGIINGKGGMRFGGYELEIPKYQLKKENGYINTNKVSYSSEVKDMMKKAREARNLAQGRQDENSFSEYDMKDNAMIPALKWYTMWKGKRVKVILTNTRKNIVKFEELEDHFPIIDRPLYPHSHDWDGTSIPDLTEDKQRMRAVALNLTMQSMQADLYPMYLYDEKRIKNKNDLLKFKFNKFIGVTGDGDVRGAAQPLNKATPHMQMVDFIMNSLDASAQRATATPDMQQGQVSEQQRTLGELNLVASKVDTRYSLTAKVFGWSERDFWRKWYYMYKNHLDSKIDEKMVRINGAFGYEYRPMMKDNLITEFDPDIKIESRVISEAKNLRKRLALEKYASLAFSYPGTNKRYLIRHLGKLNNFTKTELDNLFPSTIDEIKAKKENEILNEDGLVPVDPRDDHAMHKEIHMRAAETKSKRAHIAAHDAAMLVQRNQPELFAPKTDAAGNPIQPPQSQQQQGFNQQPQGGSSSINPQTVTPSNVAGAMNNQL